MSTATTDDAKMEGGNDKDKDATIALLRQWLHGSQIAILDLEKEHVAMREQHQKQLQMRDETIAYANDENNRLTDVLASLKAEEALESEAKVVAHDKDATIDSLRGDLRERDANILSLQKEADILREQLDLCENELATLKVAMERETVAKDDALEKIATLETTLLNVTQRSFGQQQAYRTSLDVCKKEMEKLAGTVSSVRGDHAIALADIKQLREQLHDASLEFKRVSSERDVLRLEYAVLRTECTTQDAAIEELRMTLGELVSSRAFSGASPAATQLQNKSNRSSSSDHEQAASDLAARASKKEDNAVGNDSHDDVSPDHGAKRRQQYDITAGLDDGDARDAQTPGKDGGGGCDVNNLRNQSQSDDDLSGEGHQTDPSDDATGTGASEVQESPAHALEEDNVPRLAVLVDDNGVAETSRHGLRKVAARQEEGQRLDFNHASGTHQRRTGAFISDCGTSRIEKELSSDDESSLESVGTTETSEAAEDDCDEASSSAAKDGESASEVETPVDLAVYSGSRALRACEETAASRIQKMFRRCLVASRAQGEIESDGFPPGEAEGSFEGSQGGEPSTSNDSLGSFKLTEESLQSLRAPSPKRIDPDDAAPNSTAIDGSCSLDDDDEPFPEGGNDYSYEEGSENECAFNKNDTSSNVRNNAADVGHTNAHSAISLTPGTGPTPSFFRSMTNSNSNDNDSNLPFGTTNNKSYRFFSSLRNSKDVTAPTLMHSNTTTNSSSNVSFMNSGHAQEVRDHTAVNNGASAQDHSASVTRTAAAATDPEPGQEDARGPSNESGPETQAGFTKQPAAAQRHALMDNRDSSDSDDDLLLTACNNMMPSYEESGSNSNSDSDSDVSSDDEVEVVKVKQNSRKKPNHAAEDLESVSSEELNSKSESESDDNEQRDSMIDQAEAIKEFAKKAAESQQQQQPAVSASTAASAPAPASSTKATPPKDDKKQPPNGELDPLGTGKPSLHTKYNYHSDGELCSFHDHQAMWKVVGKDRRFKTCLAVELQRPEGIRDGVLRLLVKWIDHKTGDPLFFVTHKNEGSLRQYVHQ